MTCPTEEKFRLRQCKLFLEKDLSIFGRRAEVGESPAKHPAAAFPNYANTHLRLVYISIALRLNGSEKPQGSILNFRE